MFNVTAFDQAGNLQAALWNINEVDENATEKEVIKLLTQHRNG